MKTLWTWNVKMRRHVFFCQSDCTGSSDMSSAEISCQVNHHQQTAAAAAVDAAWTQDADDLDATTETDLHWMSRDANTAIVPTVHERVVTRPPPPPLRRHESYNFSVASVSRPSHAIHSAFFIGASLQIGRADVVRCCARARLPATRDLFSNNVSSFCCTAGCSRLRTDNHISLQQTWK